MLPVHVTVAVAGRPVPIEELADVRLASMLRGAGQDIGRKLSVLLCPVHRQRATHVRVHFDERGSADLQYESCCEKLGKRIGDALG